MVAGRVVGFCNLDVTKVAEFGSGINARVLGSGAQDEEVSDRNMMTNEMSKMANKSIYMNYNLATSMKNTEMIT